MRKYLDPGSEEAMTTLDDVGRFTIAAGRLLERGGNERFKVYGLTVSDVAPLARLVQLGPMTPTELLESSVLLTSAPVASHSINRLVQSGLATRKPHESDGRKSIIEATAEGRAAMVDLHRAIRDAQTEVFAPLTPEELTTLRSLLLRCIEVGDL
jgi:DNA-binding MarR family transcriptional regulator